MRWNILSADLVLFLFERIIFVGGGAVVMKNFGSHDAKNISYNLDVKANATTNV